MSEDTGHGMIDFLSRLNEALNPHVVIKPDSFNWITLGSKPNQPVELV